MTTETILTISEREECLRAKVYMRDFSSISKPARMLALNQIKKLSKPIAKAVLKKLLLLENEQVRKIEVLGALATCNGKVDGDRGFIKDYLCDPDPEMRLAALRVVSKYEDEECFSSLTAATKDVQSGIRKEALNMACRIYGTNATPLLLRLLHDLDDGVRKSAINLSVSFECQQAVPILITMLTDDNVEIQREVYTALQKITKHNIGFDINASQECKEAAIKEWHQWWMDQYGETR